MKDYNKVVWDMKDQRPNKSVADRGLDVLIGLGALRLAGRFFIGRKDDGSGGDNDGGSGGGGLKNYNETKAQMQKQLQPIPIPVKKEVPDIFNR